MNKGGTLWITGATGMLGAGLVAAATERGCFNRICAFTHVQSSQQVSSSTVIWSTLDIGDSEALQLAVRAYQPDVIINAAAMADVDTCELHRNEALRTNARGVQYLAEASCRSGAYLIHVSTDYVFPGDDRQPGPYREDSEPRPINFYGRTKFEGECAVVNICEGQVPYTIVRTSLVYGSAVGRRPNFVSWLVRELEAGRQVRVACDQWNTPTLVDDLVNNICWIAQHCRTGIYHVAGPELVSRHEWANIIANHFGLDVGLIKSVSSSELGQIAMRPRLSGLLCERLQKDLIQGALCPHDIIEGLRAFPNHRDLPSSERGHAWESG